MKRSDCHCDCRPVDAWSGITNSYGRLRPNEPCGHQCPCACHETFRIVTKNICECKRECVQSGRTVDKRDWVGAGTNEDVRKANCPSCGQTLQAIRRTWVEFNAGDKDWIYPSHEYRQLEQATLTGDTE